MPDLAQLLDECEGFQWDDGNAVKNWVSHSVSQVEAEQVFFNRPIRVAPSAWQTNAETRFAALGRSNQGRRLTIVFTIRQRLIRVISARDMSRKERRVYDQQA